MGPRGARSRQSTPAPDTGIRAAKASRRPVAECRCGGGVVELFRAVFLCIRSKCRL